MINIMNVDKLLEAIQIIVKSEFKQLKPVLKEVVRREVKKLIKEELTKLNESKKKGKRSVDTTFMDMNMTDDDLVIDSHTSKNKDKKLFNNNSPMHAILNETYQTYNGASNVEDDEDKTVMFDSSDVHGNVHGNANTELQRASLAAKMGYGDFVLSNENIKKPGLGENTGHDYLDKALNRDYTELVRRF